MRFLLNIILCLFIVNSIYAQKSLTLNEAINIALKKNTTLEKSKNNLDSYQSDIKASYGQLLPTLGAQGGWEWNRSEEEGGYRSLQSGGVIFVPKTIIESRSYSIGAGTSWTLFNGLSNLKTINQSNVKYEAAQLEIERMKQDVVFQTITLYNYVVTNDKLLKVKEDNVLWNQKNLETVTAKNAIGAVTMADVYAQQVKLGNAELDFINAKNYLETSKSNLLYYLGLDVLTEYNYSDTLSLKNNEVDYEKEYENINSIVDAALTNRLDVKSAKLDITAANLGIDIAKGNYYPSLSNSINYYTYSSRIDNLFKSNSYSIGLTLSIPIFSNFSIENRVEYAKVNLKNTELALTELERDIKRKIQQTYLDLQAAKKGLDVNSRNVVSASENRKIEQEKYNIGSGTLLNVLIANSDYTNAQTNYINSQFSYNVLIEQLRYYLGVIDYKKFE